MEIVIDAALVREVLDGEYSRARGEIDSVGPLRALGRSQQRHDQRIASAADVGTLDCRPGCSWCCHFSVDVRAVEVFGILDYVERHFAPDAMERLRADVRVNALVLAGLDETERMTRNVRCAFLVDGQCAIYPVRPQTCRNYHATDAAGCRLSFEQPDNLDIDPDFAPGVYQAGGAHVEAFGAALHDAGFDARAYELHAALDAAMSDPAARGRFESGLPPFTQLAGEEVPAEFEEYASAG